MEVEPYVSVLLNEYIDLINLKEFSLLLKDYGIEAWEGWNESLTDFLSEENLDELPY